MILLQKSHTSIYTVHTLEKASCSKLNKKSLSHCHNKEKGGDFFVDYK